MEKIILKALELAGFKNPDVIAEIISNTPNPQVATEMLLGVYTPKVVEPWKEYRKSRYSDTIALIVSYNELGNKVNIFTYRQKTKTVYYATKEDYQNKVYRDDRSSGTSYYTTGTVVTKGVDEHSLTKEIEDFDDDFREKITPEDAELLFTSWLTFGEPIVETSDGQLVQSF